MRCFYPVPWPLEAPNLFPNAIAACGFFTPTRTGAVHHYDPRIFDLLADLTASVGRRDREIHVICGYHTPWSNEFLRTHTSGVARNSLHMQAQAIDVRLPGIRIAEFRDAAL